MERGAAVSFRRLHSSGIPLAPAIPQLPTYADVASIQKHLSETKHLSRGTSPRLDFSSVRAACYLPMER